MIENGLFSSAEFKKWSKDHVMFLHITTRIAGRKHDALLRTVGGRGFPTFVALSPKGDVLSRPRRRSLEAFGAAMAEAAELVEARGAKGGKGKNLADPAGAAMEILRKMKLGTLTNPAADRALYLKARPALKPQQREQVEKAMVRAEFQAAVQNGMTAKVGTPESDRAMLAILVAKEKLGEWPTTADMNRPMITLMRWAEQKRDPMLLAKLIGPFEKMRRTAYARYRTNDQFIQSWKDKLDALWQGKTPRPERRVIRRR